MFQRRASLAAGCGALAVVVLAALGSPAPRADVRWKNGAVDTSTPMSRSALASEIARLAARPDARHIVLHLESVPDAAAREELAAAGVDLLDPLGGNAWFARLADGADPARVAALPGLLLAEAIAPAVKLQRDLAAGVTRPWTVVASPAPGRDGAGAPYERAPLVATLVWFHRDFDVKHHARAVLALHGAKLVSTLRSLPAVLAHVPADRIPALAAEDSVMWIEPPLPRLEEWNDDNRLRVGAETLQAAPYGLDGSGVTVLVYDGGRAEAHPDFGSRLTWGDSDGISRHATHVAGTIGGDGSQSAGQYRGMAPGVNLVSYGFETGTIYLAPGFLYSDPGDIEHDYAEALDQHAIDLSNNSIGSNVASNFYPCEWEGDYGVTAALLDEIARGSLGRSPTIVWAAGNERGGAERCGADYFTVPPPACAKNPIHVGALNSDDDSMTSFSSWGPCDDGRLKPVVSGPGCQAGGDMGVTSTDDDGTYWAACGTSMASPTVAGVAALMAEQFRASRPGEPLPPNATFKAILANTALDVEEIGPDFKTGFGSVRAVPAVDTVAAGRFLHGEVGQGETYSFLVDVPADTPELRVTLAWDDPAGTPNVAPALVNDLDLRVYNEAFEGYWPWTLDPADPAAPAVNDTSDALNNIEQVRIDQPGAGLYQIEITGTAVASGAAQRFSVASSGDVHDCWFGANIETARAIGCEGTLELAVEDCDADDDSGVADTLIVEVASSGVAIPQLVTLTETGPSTFRFTGSIPYDTSGAPGTLTVSDGGTVTVSYLDPHYEMFFNPFTVTADVAVDCTAPTITSVAVLATDRHRADLSVELSEPASVRVRYGLSCAALGDLSVSAGSTASHQTSLFGLDAATTYYFSVEAEDAAGNADVDDNGGPCYSFTTEAVPEFYVEFFGTDDFDLANTTLVFDPDPSGTGYDVCRGLLGGTLPHGTANFEPNRSSREPIEVIPSTPVELFGVSYPRFWLSPYGELSFLGPNTDWSATLSDFLEAPYVSAFFRHSDPGEGGRFSWQELDDRFVASWEGILDAFGNRPSTAQIEMWHGGRIRLSWVDVEQYSPTTGLSAGDGFDFDFVERDFSEIPPCAGCYDSDFDGYIDCRDACDPGGLPCGDCDDARGTTHPGSTEFCDHRDQTCDGIVDEGFAWWAGSRDLQDPGWPAFGRGGMAVADVDDVDGDGVHDIAVGALDDAGGGGAVSIYSGATQQLLCKATDPDADIGDDLGRSVAGVGDLTGDGVPDFIVGNPTDDGPAINSGSVLLFSGADCSFVWRGVDPLSNGGAQVGFSVAAFRDWNGDLVPDVVAGAPFANTLLGGVPTGSVILFSGADGAWITRVMEDPLAVAGAQIGYSVTTGYLTDEYVSIVAGAPNWPADMFTGMGRVLFWDGVDLSRDSGVGNTDGADGDLYGTSVVLIDDLNGDNLRDFAIGIPGDTGFRGAVEIRQALYSSSRERYNDPLGNAGDHFGLSLARYEDVTGDGIDELLVGAPYNDAAGTTAGMVVVLDPTDGSIVRRISSEVAAAGDQFGFAVARVADVGGDGMPDLLVGSPYADGPGGDVGKATIISLEADCDGDGVTPFAGDCNDEDPSTLGVPGEASGLWFADTATMVWNAASGATPMRYDVLRSTLPDAFADATCLSTDGVTLAAFDVETPAAGQVFHYLIRAENACAIGPLGPSPGPSRSAPDCS